MVMEWVVTVLDGLGNAIAKKDTMKLAMYAKVGQMIHLSFFKIVFAENQYFLVGCYFDLDSMDHLHFLLTERL